jgi:tyramine---L-glutamate ligase
MQIFVYEYLSAGSWRHDSSPEPAASLLAEGAAMLHAVLADFAMLPDCQVCTIRNAGQREPSTNPASVTCHAATSAGAENNLFLGLATAAAWTLLIAPETGGVLLDRCRMVESAGGRLLSPPPDCVAIAASKQSTAERLRQCGVAAPKGDLLTARATELPANLRLPAVVKPVDGCGSLGVRLIRQKSDFRARETNESIRVEEFVAGLAASVAVLCGAAGNHALPSCEQRLSRDGRFTYLGGRLPLATELDERARRLALAAVATLPQPLGYLGIDLVLGKPNDGSDDRVIEINPRLTTSYVGLRVLSRTNLAAAMEARPI